VAKIVKKPSKTSRIFFLPPKTMLVGGRGGALILFDFSTLCPDTKMKEKKCL